MGKINDMNKTVLKICNLKVFYELEKSLLESLTAKKVKYIKAVNNISFNVYENEIIGLVGETGCGKTTLGRSTLLLEKPSSGDILFKGKSILKLKKREKINFYKQAQYIFQNPYTSLNPRMNIKTILTRPLVRFGIKRVGIEKRILEALDVCGLTKYDLLKYPHEFSGGQKQRIAIARAIINKPEFIVADEPTSSLDVSMQSKILNLLKDIKKSMFFTMIFISHDISVINYISNRTAIMYNGKIVELLPTEKLFSNRKHPYTIKLLSSIPKGPKKIQQVEYLKKKIDRVDLSINEDMGACIYINRCPNAKKECYENEPIVSEIEKGHFISCYNY